MSNLNIWESVQKTDPQFTQNFKTGFSGTSINAVYMVKQATDKFGPVGLGWGYDILEERYDEGAPINTGTDNPIFEKTHTIKICLWYMHDGKKGELVHFGHTPYFYKSSKGNFITDKEAPKKSLTDAIKKALSMLGFSADVFMGMYDDIHYVDELKSESQIESAVNKVEEQERQAKAHAEWLDEQIKLINAAVSMSMLQGVYKSAVRRLKAKGDQKGLIKLERTKDEMKKKFELKEAS